jgi:hypothetical protein
MPVRGKKISLFYLFKHSLILSFDSSNSNDLSCSFRDTTMLNFLIRLFESDRVVCSNIEENSKKNKIWVCNGFITEFKIHFIWILGYKYGPNSKFIFFLSSLQ